MYQPICGDTSPSVEVPGQVSVHLFRNQDRYPLRIHNLKADVSDGPPVKHLALPSALLLKSESVSMSRTSDNRQTYVLLKSPSHQTFPAEPPSCSPPVLLWMEASTIFNCLRF